MAGNSGGPWGGGGNSGGNGGGRDPQDPNRGGRRPNEEGPSVPEIDELVKKVRNSCVSLWAAVAAAVAGVTDLVGVLADHS